MKIQSRLVSIFNVWLALFAFLLVGQAASQNSINVMQANQEKQQQKDKGNEKLGKDKPMIESEKDDLNKQKALSMLEMLVIKAAKLTDSPQKVKIQSRLGDILWDQDKERARQLLIDAFAAIDAIEPPKDRQDTFQMPSGENISVFKMSLRQEVIQVASRHDFNLAETLRKSIIAKKDSEKEGEKPANNQPIRNSEQAIQAMRLAISLAKTNPDQSAQIVRDSLKDGINDFTVLALIGIRHEAPQLAAQLFSEAVVKMRTTPLSAIDNIGKLLPYAMPTPEERLLGTDLAQDPSWKAAIIDFFSYTSIIVSAQVKSGAGESIVDNQQLLARQREYTVLQSLRFLFDKFLPNNTQTIRIRIEQLENSLPLQAQEQGKVPNMPDKIDVEDILRQAELTSSPTKKDSLYMKAAMAAFRGGDVDYALSICNKIGNLEDRNMQDSVIRYQAGLRG